MSKKSNKDSGLWQKMFPNTITGRISSENSQSPDNIPKSDAKKPKKEVTLKEWAEKYQKLAENQALRARTKYDVIRDDMHYKYRGLNDAYVSEATREIRKHFQMGLFSARYGKASESKGKVDPNAAFKRRKREEVSLKPSDFKEDLMQEIDMLLDLDEEEDGYED